MKVRSKIFCGFYLVLLTMAAQAQTTESDTTRGIRDFSILPLPAIASTPATGFMFGVAASSNWLMGPASNTHRSTMVATAIYTTKKQLLLTAKSNVFLFNDSWNLMGDWRYFIFSQPTFGLGTGPQSSKLVSTGFEYEDGSFSQGIDEEQMMKFNYLRLHETALKRIGDTRYFLGIGYHLDIHSKIDDQLLDLDTLPPTNTSHYAYSIDKGFDPEKYTLSGISLNALWDSRDNSINPYQGRYAFISYRINPEFLGSSQNSSTLWLEYRDYFSLSKKRPRHLLAFWAYGTMMTSGTLPYLDLPSIGWDQFGRSGRAYPQGRWRGQSMVYSELEYRFPIQKHKDTFGGVVFVNTNTASNRDASIKLFDFIEPAAGLGLRFMYNKHSRSNITIDYAWGKYGAKGFYFNVYEAF